MPLRKKNKNNVPLIVGWREWIGLPELNVSRIKAKIDTGARTSALHAFSVEIFEKNHKLRVCFKIHPKQRREHPVIACEADIIDQRWITDSGGHRELRYVIHTPILIGKVKRTIEITLTNRDTMGFRMLLGRTALHQHFAVDPSRSFLMKQKPKGKSIS